jgi:hypothetical protein
MKNKSVTYLLIGGVALIWGLIIFRIFHAATEEEETFVPSQGKAIASKKAGKSPSDTFDLLLDYRDPFLGKVSVASFSDPNQIRTSAPRRKKPVVALPPAPAIDWSFIAFKGTIQNKQLNSHIGLFHIHGKDVMLRPTEQSNGVTILKVSRDSAWVQFDGVKKGLAKSH